MTQNCPPKPWLSIEQQLELMRSRGMHITSTARASSMLKEFGYYRLSGYSYVLREVDPETGVRLNSFKAGTSFDYVIELYEFDKMLRLLMLDALERIEISFRASISYHLGQRDPLFYKNPDNFKTEFRTTQYPLWLKKQQEKIEQSKEDCIRHNTKKYGDNIPVWVVCQTWEFGQLTWLLGMLNYDEVESISQNYGFLGSKSFLTWLKCLKELRNICAHHSRLWNRVFSFCPNKPVKKDAHAPISWSAAFEENEKQTLFFRVCGIIHFLKFIESESTWEERFKSALKKFPSAPELDVTLECMGFPEDWEEQVECIKNNLPRTPQSTESIGLEEGLGANILSKR